MTRFEKAPTRVVVEEPIAPGKPWARVIEAGQRLRIIDVHGSQGVDFLCYNAHSPSSVSVAAISFRT